MLTSDNSVLSLIKQHINTYGCYTQRIKVVSFSLIFTILALNSVAVKAGTDSAKAISAAQEQCFIELFQSGDATMTLADVRQQCSDVAIKPKQALQANRETAQHEQTIAVATKSTQPREQPRYLPNMGALSQRIIREGETEFDPYVITPHRMNYILPAINTNRINKDAYTNVEGYEEHLENIESKFQLSLKVPLNQNSLLFEGDGLYFGFTLQAWWQVYADGISKPFRESNYQPEIFYLAPLDWHPFGGNTGFIIGAEHQSNGREQHLSRSWNRIYSHFLFEKDDFALSFRPWIRLSEEDKRFEFDPDGDDNPDIDDFMGHFELSMAYKWQDLQFNMMSRRNFATANGALELGMTFPLWGKVRGYTTLFTGYGESLIDYNHKQTRIGVGIALNDLL